MAGYPYMKPKHGLRVYVDGMVIPDDPTQAGLDHHYLYKETEEEKKKKEVGKNKRPYGTSS